MDTKNVHNNIFSLEKPLVTKEENTPDKMYEWSHLHWLAQWAGYQPPMSIYLTFSLRAKLQPNLYQHLYQ